MKVMGPVVLLIVGGGLLLVSHYSTSYDRGTIANVEAVFGWLFLVIAAIVPLVGLNAPTTKKGPGKSSGTEPPAA